MPSVRAVMSKDLVTVDRSATVEEASAVMWARHVGSALVMLGDDLEGIFTERDIMKAISKNADRGRTMTVREFMTPGPRTIDADASVGEALDVMLTAGFRHLPVTDGGTLAGIVSMTDLVQATAKRPSE
jgi:CBS domain-containing protein